MTTATFEFHGELNRFLAPAQRGRRCPHTCPPGASVKHMIEALGVPHTEVDSILVNGAGAEFSRPVAPGDRVEVFPHGASLGSARHVPLRPPHSARFVADAHLGRLARNLRMLGIDVLYRNDYGDADLARLAATEDRIVLTRDRDLLIRKEIVHGCFVHATGSDAQLAQVLRRFDLAPLLRPFSRCLVCNHPLRGIARAAVRHQVPPRSYAAHERFYECRCCGRVYWEGSHVERMRRRLAHLLGAHDAGLPDAT